MDFIKINVIIDCLLLPETHSNEAIVLGAGPVRLCRVRQQCGRVSWLWRPLYPGVSIPGRPRLGDRKGDDISVVYAAFISALYLQLSIFRAEL